MNNVLFKLTDPITKSTVLQFETEHGFKPTKEADLTEFGYAWGAVEPRPTVTAQQALESADPVLAGVFVTQGWTVREKTPEELADDAAAKVRDVKAERDRRLAGDFKFAGKMFQRDSVSLQRITGAATLAGFAMGQGAQPGNLRWANPDADFGWIASDDTVVPMDAQTAFAFGRVAAGVETGIVFAAKALREMDPIPDDFTDDRYWP